MRTALVHDWLVAQRGGEHVLVELAKLFPEAPIYTLVHEPGSVAVSLDERTIHTSFVQRLPGAPQRFRQYLPLFPRAIEGFDLSGYDLVVSTSHCVAKGVVTGEDQVHVSYIHTPMRYLWDQLPYYVPPWPGRRLWTGAARLATSALRRWDVRSSQRPNVLVANSGYVAARIARYWKRRATVVHPPVDFEYFSQAPRRERHGLLVVSALVPYKRVELAVEAANIGRWPLSVIGDGPERGRLEALAGPTVRFLGTADRASLRTAYASAEALLFCGIEDFGIVPVEAMAAGCPVLALARGGALETVIDAETGAFFDEAEVLALVALLRRFFREGGASAFSVERLHRHASQFAADCFRSQMQAVIDSARAAH